MEHFEGEQTWEKFRDTGRIGEYLLYAALRRSTDGKRTDG